MIKQITLKKLLQTLIILLVLMQTTVFFAKTNWFFELFSHYPHYFVICGALLMPVIVAKKMWKNALILSLIISINLAIFAPYLNEAEQNPDKTEENPGQKNQDLNEATQATEKETYSDPTLKILTSNFFYKNENFEEFDKLLEDENPDIFVIHEATEEWEANEKYPRIYQEYPYMKITEKTGINGVLIGSKKPGEFKEIKLGENTGLEFKPKEIELKILGAHPKAPINKEMAEKRNQELQGIIKYSQENDFPVIVTGDFNCTPFSPYFKELLKKSGLKDARAGFGPVMTWHAHNPLLEIPIDHVILSHELEVKDFRTTEKISSDHRPILAEIELP